MTLDLALSTALSGLLTSQQGLNVVSNNISNVNTPGYTRKIANIESVVLAGQGAGAQIANITRNVDENLRSQINVAQGVQSSLQVQSDAQTQIQSLFGTVNDNTNIGATLTALTNQFSTLAAQGAAASSQTVAAGQTTAQQLNSMTTSLQAIRTSTDQQIGTAVDTINSDLTNLASLNDQISLAYATGRDTADLADQRDTLLNGLSQMLDISSYVNSSGAVSVFTKSGVTLLDNGAVNVTHSATSSTSSTGSYAQGNIGGIMVGGRDITDDIRTGSLQGLINLRDNQIPNLQSQLDALSQTLTTTTNQAMNRGTSLPAPYTLNGESQFIDTDVQTITIPGNATGTAPAGDTAISLFDSSGKQTASIDLSQLTTDGTTGTAGSGTSIWTTNSDGGITTNLTNIATGLQAWLQANGAPTATVKFSNGTSGNLEIDTGNSALGLGFRDQATATPGSAAQDLPIQFNADGNSKGIVSQSSSGFSSFFGLNNFFTTQQPQTLWDSASQPTTYTQVGSTAIEFSTTAGGINLGRVVVQNGDTLQQIADRINSTSPVSTYAVASVVPDGNGQILRIQSINGDQMNITNVSPSAASTAGYAALGLAPSSAGTSASIAVNPNLVSSPSSLSLGQMQYNSGTGQYYLSSGDISNITGVANALGSTQTYAQVGGLAVGNLSVSDYANAIINSASQIQSANTTQLTYQNSLVQTLQNKDASNSAVNLDEEMSQLITLQSSYGAAAKVISTTRDLINTLLSIVPTS